MRTKKVTIQRMQQYLEWNKNIEKDCLLLKTTTNPIVEDELMNKYKEL